MYHYIEDDLRWFDLDIPYLVLAWETEAYLAKVVKFQTFERFFWGSPEESDQGLEQES